MFPRYQLFQEGASRVNSDNVLEDRDPQYDALLSQMVGRIQAKPGGKLEMGEVWFRTCYSHFHLFIKLLRS